MISVELNADTAIQIHTDTPQDVGINSGVVFLTTPGGNSRLPVKFDIIGAPVGVDQVENIRLAIASGLANDGWTLLAEEVRLGKVN